MAPRRALAAALLAALCCATAVGYSPDLYKGYYAGGTTPLAQSIASANAALRGLQLRCALITLLQNGTWFPDNGALRALRATVRCAPCAAPPCAARHAAVV